MEQALSADYLIIGGGAMGMAFADTLLSETDATVVLVDRNHQPGGHWNVAYPYVRLHQPSAFYGVNSRELGSNRIDSSGWNEGLYELATNSEVVAYFDQVMQHQLLPTGRLQYFPSCEYTGDGRFQSLLSGARFRADTRRVVDATYMNVSVPSMRAPAYEVAPGVTCVPPNDLPAAGGRFQNYVVIGAGKTGMDACLFLLRNQVDPGRIRWIMPRDSWLLDRANIQPAGLGGTSAALLFGRQSQQIAEATDLDDLFRRVEHSGGLLRLDPAITPTMYRCATVTRAELEQLRRITGVIRQGRVTRIGTERIELESGDVPTQADTLHIDCSADGLARRPAVRVFEGDRITLQAVRTCQQVFSAAFIAHVEAEYDDDDTRNALCGPVPHPDSHLDFLRTTFASNRNVLHWAEHPNLGLWLGNARLDGFSQPRAADAVPDAAALTALQATLAITRQANDNIERLLSSQPFTEGASDHES